MLGVLALALTTLAAPADWPSHRGSLSASGFTKTEVRAPLKVVWKAPAGSRVESTAAVVGGRAYVGTMGRKVLCLDLSTGRQVWTFTGKDAFSASPCVSGGRVYISDEGGVFRALDAATGRSVWSVETEDKIVSSAVVVGGRVLFGSYDARLYCYTTAGRRVWAHKTRAQVHATPSVSGHTVAIAGCDGYVRFLRLSDGRQLRSFELKGNISATPAWAGSRAFVGSMNATYAAIDAATAKPAWSFREREKDAACYASAATDGRNVVFGSRSARAFCVDARTGRLKWTARTGDGVDSSPVISGGWAHFGCDDGALYSVRLADGRTWKQRLGASIKSSPAVGGGRIVISTEGGLVYCLKGS
jgi:outer membrane protein assembly factor BamB